MDIPLQNFIYRPLLTCFVNCMVGIMCLPPAKLALIIKMTDTIVLLPPLVEVDNHSEFDNDSIPPLDENNNKNIPPLT